ncbi:HAMP domain-containing histidine kinase [Phycicoccus endophyticus]|uniref:histidine kinase n=1 Tax=Phycicoccus endophyticus TaxID=1690220 RepID=A0A7G9R1N6_9MICO|nr:HAMP domain-containing sensor histidine kinase [Phycicoccus endophyticus]NHI18698.1 HAMP domain-containing histidine kinase [Phycicoccus endophyticus]QNN49511.1 HAMP domain-containing histidine kinase [Phycicoccus endophyticus]GGL37126.1 two-component sensor histidine kinase [Phycicoccus endophyticus]
MSPDASAVLLSAVVTALAGVVGALVLARLSRHRPVVAALGAPLVLVGSLAAGVAVATRSMLIGEDDYRTLVFVLLAGAPMAVLVGVVLARRVWRLERESAAARAAHERDREVERSRRETIRWLSHDLRTPLAGIRLLAESLEDDAVAEPHAAHARIVHEVDRVDGMVDDIAELSRLQAPTATRRERVELDDVVSDAVAGVGPLADAASVAVVGGELAGTTVLGDARALTRAVSNVLRNAVQHTDAGGQVRVVTRREGDAVVVEVTDGCGGVPPEALEHLFEPGWRGDHARHERGMGLGLTITREVARAHGGDAHAANLPDGSGCVVALSVPRGGATE